MYVLMHIINKTQLWLPPLFGLIIHTDELLYDRRRPSGVLGAHIYVFIKCLSKVKTEKSLYRVLYVVRRYTFYMNGDIASKYVVRIR